MPRAIWNKTVIAESETCEVVENNVYFPPEAVKNQYLKPSDTTSTCPWKGKASYFTLDVNGEVNKDAAWYYPDPKPAAESIKNYVAFWKGVTIVK
jgi:uncharacterized protein (DUF427 family)